MSTKFNFSENSTPLGGGLAAVGTSVVMAGLEILNQGPNLVGLAMVVAGLLAILLGGYAAYRPEKCCTDAEKDAQ